MEYEQNRVEQDRVIREAREARETVDKQQAELAQFHLFLEFLATQEAPGRVLDNPSDESWQNIRPPPSSTVPDNGAPQLLRVSTDSLSTKPSTTSNCPLCRNSLDIPGHTLEQCPIVTQLGL